MIETGTKFDIMSAPPGTKIKFLNKNGYTSEPVAAVKLGLVENNWYTLRSVRISGSSSLVFLEEFPNKGFNTVMFECGCYDEPYPVWYNMFKDEYGY